MIDKAEVVSLLGNDSLVANGLVFYKDFGFDETISHTYDLAEAEKLVKENDLAGQTVRISARAIVPDDIQIAKYLESKLNKVGLRVELETDMDRWVEQITSSFDYHISVVSLRKSGGNNPLGQLRSFLHTDVDFSLAGIEPRLREQISALFEDAYLAYDPEDFVAIIGEIDRLVRENYLIIPLAATLN